MKPRALTITWIALLALTAGSYYLADGASTTTPALFLFGFAAIKLCLIQGVFMELYGCRPIFLRLATLFDILILGLIVLPFTL